MEASCGFGSNLSLSVVQFWISSELEDGTKKMMRSGIYDIERREMWDVNKLCKSKTEKVASLVNLNSSGTHQVL